MRGATVLTRLCGGTALVAAAVAIGLALAREGTPTPRWDVVAALGGRRGHRRMDPRVPGCA